MQNTTSTWLGQARSQQGLHEHGLQAATRSCLADSAKFQASRDIMRALDGEWKHADLDCCSSDGPRGSRCKPLPYPG